MTSEQRFAELWADYLEGDLDDAGVTELEALLAADESLRVHAADLLQTHRLLGFALQESTATGESFVRSTLARLPLTEEAFVDSLVQRLDDAAKPHGPAPKRWFVRLFAHARAKKLLLAGAGVLALCLVAALVWRNAAQPRAQEPFATLIRATDCVWEAPAHPQPGDRLPAGKLNLQEGLAEIKLANGVELLIEGPTRMELVNLGRSVLQAGRIVARVPATARGYAVETRKARFIDLGTEFGISVAPDRETVAQVFDGVVVAEVNKTDASGQQSHRLAAGEMVRIDAGGTVELQRIGFSHERFLRTFSRPSVHEGDELIPFQPSRVSSLDVVAAARPVTVDGDLSEWDLASVFEVRCAEPFAGSYYVQGRMMYDEQYLFIAARVGDPMPMRNLIDPNTDPWSAWMGGGLHVRLCTDRAAGWPVKARWSGLQQPASTQDTSDRIAHLVLWYFQPREQPCLGIRYGMSMGRGVVNPPGWSGAFRKAPDGRSYTVECAIPWTLLGAGGDPPRAGDVLGLSWTVDWGDASGRHWKGQLVEIKNPAYADRGKDLMTFRNAETWGKAVYR